MRLNEITQQVRVDLEDSKAQEFQVPTQAFEH